MRQKKTEELNGQKKRIKDHYTISSTNTGEIKIGRAKRKDLKEIIEAQNILIEAFVLNNAAIANIIIEDNIWEAIEVISRKIPVIGKEDTTLYDLLDDLESEYPILCDLFFADNWDGDFNKANDMEPSIICKLHMIDYASVAGKALTKLREEYLKKKELLDELSA